MRIFRHLLAPVFLWMTITPIAGVSGEEVPIGVEVIVSSVAKENIEEFALLQAQVHQKLEQANGFIGSFRGQGSNAIYAWDLEGGGPISKETGVHEGDGILNNIFIDYVFWQNPSDMKRAAKALENDPVFQRFASLIEKSHAFLLGRAIDNSTYMATDLDTSILEVALYRLNKPFEDELISVRPPIVEWLEHLRGYRGLITAQSDDDPLLYSDIVVWTNLPDAEFATNTLNKYDFGKEFSKAFEIVTLYGHFAIRGTHGRLPTK